MYVVDFVFGSLVSWISIMCGLLCSVCVRSWIPGKLELMHPVFHVMILSVCVDGRFGLSCVCGVL